MSLKMSLDDNRIMGSPIQGEGERKITPGFTSFFRDLYMHSTIIYSIIPDYKAKQKKPIKIASVGCSTGEELYSLVLANWESRYELEFHGYDAYEPRIARARKGEYVLKAEPNAATKTGPFWEPVKRYANQELGIEIPSELVEVIKEDETKERIKITEEVKQRVSFSIHNFLDAHLPQKYNVICLQNVMNHLSPEEQETALNNIYESLEDGGWLLVDGIQQTSAFKVVDDPKHAPIMHKHGFYEAKFRLRNRGAIFDQIEFKSYRKGQCDPVTPVNNKLYRIDPFKPRV